MRMAPFMEQISQRQRVQTCPAFTFPHVTPGTAAVRLAHCVSDPGDPLPLASAWARGPPHRSDPPCPNGGKSSDRCSGPAVKRANHAVLEAPEAWTHLVDKSGKNTQYFMSPEFGWYQAGLGSVPATSRTVAARVQSPSIRLSAGA